MVAFLTLWVPVHAPLVALGALPNRTFSFTIGLWLLAEGTVWSIGRRAVHPALVSKAEEAWLTVLIASACSRVLFITS